MDIKELKNLVKNSGAVLVVDNNEPSLVVMDYQTYKNIVTNEQPAKVQVRHESNGVAVKQNATETYRQPVSGGADGTSPRKEGELEILERINKEILALKDEIEREEKGLAVDID